MAPCPSLSINFSSLRPPSPDVARPPYYSFGFISTRTRKRSTHLQTTTMGPTSMPSKRPRTRDPVGDRDSPPTRTEMDNGRVSVADPTGSPEPATSPLTDLTLKPTRQSRMAFPPCARVRPGSPLPTPSEPLPETQLSAPSASIAQDRTEFLRGRVSQHAPPPGRVRVRVNLLSPPLPSTPAHGACLTVTSPPTNGPGATVHPALASRPP